MDDRGLTRRQFVGRSVAAAGGVVAGARILGGEIDGSKILNFNPEMEYRRCGKTGLMVSAVCLGGHWKRLNEVVKGVFQGGNWLGVDVNHEGFRKNRAEVVSRCIEAGMNYIDACTIEEVRAYSAALQGRRERMYLGCSWYQKEMRNGNFRTKEKLLQTLDEGMKEAKLDYVDLWRITMHEASGRHTEKEVEEMMEALAAAKKSGKVRFAGFSSHDRPHIKKLIETYPEVVDAIVTPYTARTKALPQESLFDTLRTYDVGFFGIKPFAGTSLFKGTSAPGDPNAKEDDERARLAIRYILCNPAITAPIPGLIDVRQVDNVARAVKERRSLDLVETAALERAMDEAWAKLPPNYAWLKDWEYV